MKQQLIINTWVQCQKIIQRPNQSIVQSPEAVTASLEARTPHGASGQCTSPFLDDGNNLPSIQFPMPVAPAYLGIHQNGVTDPPGRRQQPAVQQLLPQLPSNQPNKTPVRNTVSKRRWNRSGLNSLELSPPLSQL